jgi:hypothetical protein
MGAEGSKKLRDDGSLLPKHVGDSIRNKVVVQSVHILVNCTTTL